MNRLLVSDIIDLNSGEYIIDATSNNIKIKVNGEVTIYLVSDILNILDIHLSDNSNLKLFRFRNNVKNNLVVNIRQNNSSIVNYNESFINDKNSKLIINNYIKGNNNTSNINVRNICNNENSEITINVSIDKNTFNNIALEDLKGINNGGFIHIEPNIICESNEVMANHLTTIGSLDRNSLNYLMSKGIELENAKKILLKGFIYSNMDDYIRTLGGE